MKTQDAINYQRISKAIEYIRENFKKQPSLEKIAEAVNLSPFHFQRLFTEWAGVSPKQFAAYLSVDYARQILKKKENTLFDAALQTGLSGTGRLHDLFVKIEGMTPGEFKNGGEQLLINYSFNDNLFGTILVASTAKGICYMAFIEDKKAALDELRGKFPNATYCEKTDELQRSAIGIFENDWSKPRQIRIHLKGTEFQLKVWEALLKIPFGHLTSYGDIAGAIGTPKASRAVGSAIGDNPVAFVIPCHRVIQSGGLYGQYRWGSIRKSALIGWEASKTYADASSEF